MGIVLEAVGGFIVVLKLWWQRQGPQRGDYRVGRSVPASENINIAL